MATNNPPDADIMLEIRLRQVQTDAESRDAYDDLYDVTDISQRPSFYLWLLELFNLQPDDVYLDVSCGRGQLAALAGERCAAHGLDLSHRALVLGRRSGAQGHLVTGNGQQLPYADERFTVVSNIGSLEHYVDMAAAVREMARVLRPPGRAYVLVPNTFSLTYNILVAWRQGRTHVDDQPIQRYAARQEWRRLLEENGLIVEKTIKYERERPRTWADLGYHLRHPKQLVRLVLAPLVPLNLAFCFVFVCRKAEGRGG